MSPLFGVDSNFTQNMIINIIWLLAGVVLILAGANFLTDGAASLARRIGISDLVVGLTVVAFGTSAPELVVSIMSAISGNAGLAIGNVVGSNLFNVLVIIGVTAMVRPIVVETSILTKDIPLVVLSALVLLVMGNGVLLNGDSQAVITRSDGLILLLFFAIFMRYTFSQAKSQESDRPIAKESDKSKEMPVWRAIIYIAGGLAGLIFGGDWFVDGASGIASALGVSDAIIGLTIVAAGTSLPELATSVMAAAKGKPGIAVGNVIGSNIFNIFLVLGCAASINPLPFGSIGNLDLIALTVACFLFWLFGWAYKNRTITRGEGAILTLCYIGYIVYLISQISFR